MSSWQERLVAFVEALSVYIILVVCHNPDSTAVAVTSLPWYASMKASGLFLSLTANL